MRLFACTFLDAGGQAYYDELAGALVSAFPNLLRSIPPGSAHVTYAFLGRVDPALIPGAARAIGAALTHHQPFEVRLARPSVLAAGRDARLIHAAIADGAERLVRLSAVVAEALDTALPGVAIDRSKSPHVTLARFRRGTSRQTAEPVTDWLATDRTDLPRPQRMTTVHLVSSDLTDRRPIYTRQATVAIGTPTSA